MKTNDTELVIKLPEEVMQAFSEALKTHTLDASTTNAILDAVASGVPLPKDHGNLKDEDEITHNIWCALKDCNFNELDGHMLVNAIDAADTLIVSSNG